MKKIVAMLVLFVFGSTLNAGLTYIGTFSGNDTPAVMDSIENDVEQWFLDNQGITREIEFDLYEHWDVGSPVKDNLELDNFIDNDDGEPISGEWKTDDPIEFFTLKSGSSFALFWVDSPGGALSGDWSTFEGGLVNKKSKPKGLSHFSAWNPQCPPPAVPAPGAILLASLGTGFIARFRRKLN